MTPELGYRLAGFADGEGHFGIQRVRGRHGHVTYLCVFAVNLRDDDTPFLERFRDETNLGVIYNSGPRTSGVPNGKPQGMWRVQRRRECLTLVEAFETYPLWVKAREFAIWAQSVRYWNGPKPLGWAPMALWFQEIRDARVYQAPEFAESEQEIASLFDPAYLSGADSFQAKNPK